MFVVGTVERVFKDNRTDFDTHWPVVFEEPDQGYVAAQVGKCTSREAAQQLADKLNDVLKKSET